MGRESGASIGNLRARSLAFYRAGRVLSDRLGALDKAAEAFEGAARETPTDRVVINGYQFARPGTKAVTKAGKIAADAPDKAPAGPNEPVSAQATFAK